jgi:HEAT repeat protein
MGVGGRLCETRPWSANGGTEAQQEEIISLLSRTATSDKSGLCRVAAIDALGRFEDPRVPQILTSAYHNAAVEAPASVANAPEDSGDVETVGFRRKSGLAARRAAFTPEDVTAIQCRSLEALGEGRSPAGLTLLCEVAATPIARAESKETHDLLNPLGEGVNREAVRVAAVRALGNYRGDRQAAETLIRILQNEKDVVLRSRAYESLVNVTGERLPPDAQVWQDWISRGRPAQPPAANTAERENSGN